MSAVGGSGDGDSLEGLLVAAIPRDLVLGVLDGLEAGAMRGYLAAKDMHQGHMPNVLGQMRHFHMNEGYAEALAAAGIPCTALRGNVVVVGTSGIVRLGRFNLSHGVWNNARRSKSRLVMAKANSALETSLYGDLFDSAECVTTISAFFVSVFSGSMHIEPERPVSVEIAVPDSQMNGWLFRENLEKFITRYDANVVQPDLAVPRLRKIDAGQADT